MILLMHNLDYQVVESIAPQAKKIKYWELYEVG